MEKEIWPRGCTLNYTNIIGQMIIYIVLVAFLFVSGISNNPKDFAEFKKFAFAVIIINTIFLCFDVYRIYRVYKRRKQREWCKKNAISSSKGMVLEIKEEWIDYKGRQAYGSSGVGIDHGNILYYRMLVSYTDPHDGCIKKAESDLYYKNPTDFLENVEIIVYIRKNPQPLIAIYKQR